MEKKRPDLCKKEKDIRHIKNLTGYSGFWHGMYFLLGVYKPNKNKLPKSKTIFKFRKT